MIWLPPINLPVQLSFTMRGITQIVVLVDRCNSDQVFLVINTLICSWMQKKYPFIFNTRRLKSIDHDSWAYNNHQKQKNVSI